MEGGRNGGTDRRLILIRKRITQIVVVYSSLILIKSTIQHAMKLSARALRNIAESGNPLVISIISDTSFEQSGNVPRLLVDSLKRALVSGRNLSNSKNMHVVSLLIGVSLSISHSVVCKIDHT